MKNKFETEVVTHCILCNHRMNEPDPWFSKQLSLISPFDIRKCVSCGLRWLSPRPTQDEYKKLYTDDCYFGGDQSVESFSDLSNVRRPYFRARLKCCEQFFPKEKKLKILDIGAATGDFVYEALKLRHYADGIELSEDAIRAAKKKYGINLVQGSLDSIHRVAYYDIVHLNHVLEHLPDPIQGIKACCSVLKTGGIFIVEVPQELLNDLEVLKKTLGMKKEHSFNPYSLHHTYFFSPAILSRALEKYGFEILRLKTANSNYTPLNPFQLQNFLLRLFLYMADRLHQGGNIIEIFARKVTK